MKVGQRFLIGGRCDESHLYLILIGGRNRGIDERCDDSHLYLILIGGLCGESQRYRTFGVFFCFLLHFVFGFCVDFQVFSHVRIVI